MLHTLTYNICGICYTYSISKRSNIIMNSLQSILSNKQTALYIFGCGLYMKVACQNEMVVDNELLDIALDPHHVQSGHHCIISREHFIGNMDAVNNPDSVSFDLISNNFKNCITQIYEKANHASIELQQPNDALVKTHARLSPVDALKFDLILAGTVLKFKYHSIALDFLEECIGTDLTDYLNDYCKAHLHPFYPSYAVPAVTFKSSITDAFIPCNLFNRYGEYIGNQEIEVETLAITGIEQDIIPDLGISPSLEHFKLMFEKEMADEE